MHSPKEPFISVILPVRNEEKYLKGTIESILSQTFNNFELVVINDASEDKTDIILEEYCAKDSRIKIIKNQTAKGVAFSVNRGIEEAKGGYIARIDAADIARADRLQRQFNYLVENRDVMVVGSFVNIINKNYHTIGQWITPIEVNGTVLYRENGVIQPSVMFRRELFEKVGKYNPSILVGEDFDLWFRVTKNKSKIANISEFLTSIMERENGLSLGCFVPMQISTFRIKLKYLPYFFNWNNCLYTIRSLLGVIFAFTFGKKFILHYSNKINQKVYV